MDDIERAIKWAEEHPLSKALIDCPQDPEWHAEGDVWEHTKMVMRTLPSINNWESLCESDKRILIMAALFHDIAKPEVTRVDEAGRIRAPRHSVRGEEIARRIMYKFGVAPAEREVACNLVRFHMKPIHIMDNDVPERTCIETSEYVGNNNLLYFMAMADNLGRIAEGKDESVDKINLWREIAIETGCYNHKLDWNKHTRTKYLRDREMHHAARIDMPFKFTAVIFVGLPGSGKSHHAKMIRLPSIEPDAIRKKMGVRTGEKESQVWSVVREQYREYARNKQSFAIDATNLVRDMRAPISRILMPYGAKIAVYHVDKPIDVVLKQNRERDQPVPESVIYNMMERMQIPRYDECHEFFRIT